ncbi:MAG: acetyltransferase, partial [Zetaproteobacteria bacterium]
AAAFGDNLHAPASRLARAIGLSEAEAQALRTLGETINYNAYGLEIEDLHMHPKALAEAMDGFTDPWAFMQTDAFRRIAEGFAEDRAAAESLKPEAEGPGWAVYALPDAPWARRMIGVLANELARAHPERAHALLLPMPGGWRVSVRAPKSRPYGAGKLCAQFPTGGGREAAGGINLLPDDLRASFIDALARAYQA